MIIEKQDKIFENLSQEILNISKFSDLKKLMLDYFKSEIGLCSKYFLENPSEMVSRAYNHDYRTWINRLNSLSQFSIEDINSFENDTETLADLDFYKSALHFLTYLATEQNQNYDKPIKTSSLEFLLKKESAEHNLELPLDLPDEISFSQFYLIWNFVINSCDAFQSIKQQDGIIRLDYNKGEKTTSFAILDNGKGISEDDFPKIFGDYSSNTTLKNKGFGLYGAHHIVQGLGDKIGVISQKEGKLISCLPEYGCSELSDKSLLDKGFNTKFYVLLKNR